MERGPMTQDRRACGRRSARLIRGGGCLGSGRRPGWSVFRRDWRLH